MALPKVLSFDVGISNLCCCLLTRAPGRIPEFPILRWNVLNLGTSDLTAACEALPKRLMELPYLDMADVVLIEQQTTFNTKMKVMSHALQTFFVTRRNLSNAPKPEVVFISPRRKLQVYSGPPIAVSAKNDYKANKKRAIEHCKCLISEDPPAYSFLMGLRKKDDAADAFLQGAFYLRSLSIGAAAAPVSAPVVSTPHVAAGFVSGQHAPRTDRDVPSAWDSDSDLCDTSDSHGSNGSGSDRKRSRAAA